MSLADVARYGSSSAFLDGQRLRDWRGGIVERVCSIGHDRAAKRVLGGASATACRGRLSPNRSPPGPLRPAAAWPDWTSSFGMEGSLRNPSSPGGWCAEKRTRTRLARKCKAQAVRHLLDAASRC